MMYVQTCSTTPSSTRLLVTDQKFRRVAELVDGMAVCSVADNGIGIPPEHHERVFQLLTRLDGATELGVTKSGAGLAIVARILERHGGKVWIEPRPSCGTTFRLSLPLSD